MSHFEAGSVVWHPGKGGFAMLLALHDADAATLDFGQGDEQRAKLDELELALAPQVVKAFRDVFRDVRRADLAPLSHPHDLREQLRAAVSFLASQDGLSVEWRQHPADPGWNFHTAEVFADRQAAHRGG